jgi:uncharacterized protein
MGVLKILLFATVVILAYFIEGLKPSTKSIDNLESAISKNSEYTILGCTKSSTKFHLDNMTLFLGGIVHGLFTCRGPFVVMYATKISKIKVSLDQLFVLYGRH